MKVHIDVMDAAGNRVGEGPVTSATSVSVTRELSGTGKFSINVPANDYLAASALTNERRVYIYEWDEDKKAAKKLLGAGIIRKVGFSRDSGSEMLAVSGPDILDELKRINTWLAYTEDDETPGNIIDNLLGLTSGWAADTSDIPAIDPLSIRLDGASILKGIQEVCSQKGIHFRLGEGREIEVGDFGDDAGLIITDAGNAIYPQLLDNSGVVLIERLQFEYDTEAVANKIVPLGTGDAEAALNLKFSTRTTPYTIQNMSVNGQTLYYLSDATSITEYGTIEKVLRASGVAALSNSTTDLENAANALYDVAANWLERYSVRQEVYRVTLRNVKEYIKPGQQIRLEFMGYAVDENWEPVRWVNVRDDFWVLSVTERLDLQGRVVDLQLSNVDRVQEDAAKIIIGALDELDTRNTIVKPYLNMYMQPLQQEAIDSTHQVIFPFEIGDYVARLNQVILRLWTRPFRATAQAAASGGGTTATSSSGGGSTPTSSSGGGSTPTSSSGGDHRHKMFAVSAGAAAYASRLYGAITSLDGSQFMFVGIDTEFTGKDIYTYDSSGAHTHNVTIPAHTHTVTISAHTHDITIPNHTHSIVYGIADDTSTPATVRVYVDNVQVSGSPFAAGGGNQALEIDITALFAESGFQGDHEIKVTCGSGQGLVFGHIEIRQTIQSIRVV